MLEGTICFIMFGDICMDVTPLIFIKDNFVRDRVFPVARFFFFHMDIFSFFFLYATSVFFFRFYQLVFLKTAESHN